MIGAAAPGDAGVTTAAENPAGSTTVTAAEVADKQVLYTLLGLRTIQGERVGNFRAAEVHPQAIRSGCLRWPRADASTEPIATIQSCNPSNSIYFARRRRVLAEISATFA
jgi:hypothetical protein